MDTATIARWPGKISAAFQTQIKGGSRTAFHTDLGFILLETRCMARLSDQLRVRPRVLAELLAAVTGHHGGPPALYEENDFHRFSQHLGDQAS